MGLHSLHNSGRARVRRRVLILGLGGILVASVGIFAYSHFKGQEKANTSVREQAEVAESTTADSITALDSYVLVRKKGHVLEWRKADYGSKQAVMYVDGVTANSTKEWGGDDVVLTKGDVVELKGNEVFEYSDESLINKDDTVQLRHSTKVEAQRFIGGKLSYGYRVLEEVYMHNGFTVLLVDSANSEILYVSYADGSETANNGTIFVLSSKEQASIAYKLGFNILPAIYKVQ